MNLGSREHEEILKSFEKNFYWCRLDKEEKELWKKGRVYQNGETNRLYAAYILGYSAGRCAYLNS